MTPPPENAAGSGRDDENGAADDGSSAYVPVSRYGAPAQLVVAAALAFLEGLVLVVYGVVEVFRLSSDRAVMGATVSIFFIAFGGLLVVCGWGLHRVWPWTRGPVLLAQLVQLGLAYNFRGGQTLALAILLAVVAVVVLIGLLHPRSIEAIEKAADRA